jgi:hypothetical protein
MHRHPRRSILILAGLVGSTFLSLEPGQSQTSDLKTTNGLCSVYADNHLQGSNHSRLSWQVSSSCGRFVTSMKLTYSVLKDGRVWYGGSRTRSGPGDLGVADTPYCSSGTHQYRVRADLNYYYFNSPQSLHTDSITLSCRG